MAFQYAILICSTPGRIFGTLDPRFGPKRVPAGLGTFLAQNWGPEKLFLWRKWAPHVFLWGSAGRDWIVWCPGGHWARRFAPKLCQRVRVPPWASMVDPYCPAGSRSMVPVLVPVPIAVVPVPALAPAPGPGPSWQCLFFSIGTACSPQGTTETFHEKGPGPKPENWEKWGRAPRAR